MKVISEISLRDFKFWGGGEDRAKNCTDEQLDKIESIMESDAPESGWADDENAIREELHNNQYEDRLYYADGCVYSGPLDDVA